MSEFNFENLEVWKKAISFAVNVIESTDAIETSRKHFRLIEQLESSSASIALNIAEGKGRYSKKEFIQHLYIAKGSLNETITLLIIFNNKGWIKKEQLGVFRQQAEEIGKMLSSLIASIRKTIG